MEQPLETGAVHEPEASSQVSVVHERPSEHVVLVGHMPPALHTPQPGTLASAQRTPGRAVHPVVLAATVHAWQTFAGFTAPSAQQAPVMRQPAETGYAQFPFVSSQLSPVHERPSLQLVFVAQMPAPLHMPQPAGAPSSQRTPARALQVVVLAAESHHWHGLLELIVPAA